MVGTLIDEEKVMFLGQLIRDTNAKVILHSGWKFWFDSEVKPLRKEAERLVSMLEKWIVIDDLDLHNEEIRKHQILTDASIGLTVENICEAERLLL